MEILAFAMLLGVITAAIASAKNRSVLGWWVAGVACFIVAIIVILVLPALPKAGAGSVTGDSLSAQLQSQLQAQAQAQALSMKRCPMCAEHIQLGARVCRYCGTKLEC